MCRRALENCSLYGRCAALALAVALQACTQSPSPAVPAPTGPDSSVTGMGDGQTAMDAASTDAGPIGSGFVRPVCEACVKGDAGVCCVYPNPTPPPGPENAISCAVCPGDAGPKFITLACNNEADCPMPEVCCIAPEPGNTVRSFCAVTCDATKHQAGLCDANASTSVCPKAAPCSRSNIDDWNLPHCYGTCGGVSP